MIGLRIRTLMKALRARLGQVETDGQLSVSEAGTTTRGQRSLRGDTAADEEKTPEERTLDVAVG